MFFIIWDPHNFNLVNINGGNFNNVIPNASVAKIFITSGIDDRDIIKILNVIIAEELMNYKENEPEFDITFDSAYNDKTLNVLSDNDTDEVINALYELPDGLIATFEDKPEVAEISFNLGILKTKDEMTVKLKNFKINYSFCSKY